MHLQGWHYVIEEPTLRILDGLHHGRPPTTPVQRHHCIKIDGSNKQRDGCVSKEEHNTIGHQRQCDCHRRHAATVLWQVVVFDDCLQPRRRQSSWWGASRTSNASTRSLNSNSCTISSTGKIGRRRCSSGCKHYPTPHQWCACSVQPPPALHGLLVRGNSVGIKAWLLATGGRTAVEWQQSRQKVCVLPCKKVGGLS